MSGPESSNLRDIHSVEDFRRRAKRRLPGFVFDFLEGAAGDESSARRNLVALSEATITPRLGDGSKPPLPRIIFGNSYSAPFGVAPLGLAELVFPRADIVLARAAAEANIPYICSGASGTAVGEIAKLSGRVPWFQLYCPSDAGVVNSIVNQLECEQVEVLVVTVDVRVPGKRLRDLRNGLSMPLKPSIRLVWDGMTSPGWGLRRLMAGKIGFPNFEQHMRLSHLPFRDLMALQTGGRLDWDWLKQLRERWRGKLVLKGVLCEHEATKAQALGVDGLIVSNHGGRQFDAAPASFHCLEPVRAAAAESCVMFDSGVRSGTDIVRSLRHGSEMTWIGRPFLYALAAVGEEGPRELIRMLKAETHDALALSGPPCQEGSARPLNTRRSSDPR